MNTIIHFNEEKNSTGSQDFLENLAREGARKMLAAALEAEVAEFMEKHKGLKDEKGHQAVVRNGYMPERQIQALCGNVTVRQPRIDDRALPQEERFTSAILPKFMRKTPTLENVIPVLYLKGISTNKFKDAMAEKNWRRLKGFEKLQLVKEDRTFIDGVLAA
ncbi:MAG: transposase [Treponemataceae bacterium]